MNLKEENEELKRRLNGAEALVGERAELDAALRESEARHRLLIESWAQAVWETDGAGVVVTDSPSWRAHTGQTFDQWVGYGWLDAIHPDDRAYAERQWREAMATRRLVNAEFRIGDPGGEWRWTNVRATPVLDADGNIEKWAGMNIDIDARKRAEAALRESEERQAYFLALSDALRPLADQAEIQAEAMRLLGEKIGVNRAQYYIADETGEYLSSDGGYSNGIPAAIGRFHLIEFGKYAFDGFHAGETQVVSDATTDPRISEEVLQSYRSVGFLAYIGVPFVQRGRLVGTLAVHQSEPRQWTASERMMVEETAQRAGIAVEQARAESALRESQERQAFLLRLSDALRPLSDPVAIQETAMQVLGPHLKVNRAFYADVGNDDDALVIWTGYSHGTFPLEGQVRVSEFELDMADLYQAGRTYVIEDTQRDERWGDNTKARFRSIEVGAAISVPLVKGGRVRAIVSLHQSSPRLWTGADIALLEETAERTWAAVERARAEAAQRESEERFAEFANASAAGLWIRDAGSMAMEFGSPAIAKIYGVEDDALLGDVSRWAAMIVPEDRDAALGHLEKARRGEAVVHEFRIQRPSDGAFRWIRNTDFPLHGNGHVTRIGGVAEDITEAKLAVEHQGVLLAELQHRVRNIMAILRSIASRSAASAGSAEEYGQLLAGRIDTFARVQALLTRSANTGVGLGVIVQNELSALALHQAQIDAEGPEVTLSPKAAETMTLAIHELATNALKYGALSVLDGRVRVRWEVQDRQGSAWLSFDWQETGAPNRETPGPRRVGFGSELIEGRIPYELNGQGRVVIEHGNASCHLEFPLTAGASVLETGAPRRASVFGGTIDMTGHADLAGQRVLVVEDDYYLASDTSRALIGAGAQVVGPCPTEQTARQAIAESTPTCAVLDINLFGGRSFNLASDFMRDGVPFIFITGYDQDVIPPEFGGITRLQKPVDFHGVVHALGEAIRTSAMQ